MSSAIRPRADAGSTARMYELQKRPRSARWWDEDRDEAHVSRKRQQKRGLPARPGRLNTRDREKSCRCSPGSPLHTDQCATLCVMRKHGPVAERPTTRPPGDRPRARRSHARAVGVRELRQNLSVHLARVKRGEALEVLERGHVIALLVPVEPAATTIDRLVAAGRATRATRTLAEFAPPGGELSSMLGSAILDGRDDRL